MNESKLNIRYLQRLAFFYAFPISAAYVTPFFLSKGLSQAEIYLTQSVYSLVFLLWSIPSGYIADRIGKSKTIKLGVSITGLTLSLYGFGSHFWQFMILEVFLAIGQGLVIGADSALLIDSLVALRRKKEFIKQSQFIKAAGFISIAFGVPVAVLLVKNLSLGATLTADGILVLMGLYFAWRLREVHVTRHVSVETNELEAWRSLRSLIAIPSIRWMLILLAMLGAGPYLAFWLAAPYYQHIGISLLLFGPILALRSVWKAFLSYKYHSSSKMVIRMFSYATLLIGVFLGMATQNIWLVWVVLGLDIIESLSSQPLISKINEKVEPRYRATMNSAVDIVNKLAFIVLGPLAGLVVDVMGLGAGLIVIGAACGLFALLATRRLATLNAL